MTHEEWWREVGSGMPPMPGEDAHEHVQRVTAPCWPAAIYEAEAAQLTGPMRKNAERYRWLRDMDVLAWKRSGDHKAEFPTSTGKTLDAEIDAALLKTPNAEVSGPSTRPLG